MEWDPQCHPSLLRSCGLRSVHLLVNQIFREGTPLEVRLQREGRQTGGFFKIVFFFALFL